MNHPLLDERVTHQDRVEIWEGGGDLLWGRLLRLFNKGQHREDSKRHNNVSLVCYANGFVGPKGFHRGILHQTPLQKILYIVYKTKIVFIMHQKNLQYLVATFNFQDRGLPKFFSDHL